MELTKDSQKEELENANKVLNTLVNEICNTSESGTKRSLKTNDIENSQSNLESSAIITIDKLKKVSPKSQNEMVSSNNAAIKPTLDNSKAISNQYKDAEIEENKTNSIKDQNFDQVKECLEYIKDQISNEQNGISEAANDNEQVGSLNNDGTAKDEIKRKIQMAKASERDLWISNVSLSTKAIELKNVFSRHGKVLAAKVISNTKSPLATCYGYVTMKTREQSETCIKYLNNTELCGQLISVGWAHQISKSSGERPHKSNERDAKANAVSREHVINPKEEKPSKKLCSHRLRDGKPQESSRSSKHQLSMEKSSNASKDKESHRSTRSSKTTSTHSTRKRSRSPHSSSHRRRSRSPKRARSKSSRRSKSPRESYSKGPRRRHSRSPQRKHSRSPQRHSRSPWNRSSRSPNKRNAYPSHSPRRTSGYQRLPSPPYNKPTISKSYAPSYLNMLTFDKIKEEQNRERERQRIREIRDHSKYRSSDLNDIEEINKKEALRLELERKNIRMEKERLNLELARLEKRAVTNQKLLERERELFKKSANETFVPMPPPVSSSQNYFVPNYPPNSIMQRHDFPMQMPPQGFMPIPFPPFCNRPLAPNSMAPMQMPKMPHL